MARGEFKAYLVGMRASEKKLRIPVFFCFILVYSIVIYFNLILFLATDKLNPGECDCPVQCEKIKYGLQLSSAYFPSPHFWDTVYQLLNESENENTSDTLQRIIRLEFFLNYE